jgi:endonuclease/exonuclease/phosphatase family metal-dependent hydrolase
MRRAIVIALVLALLGPPALAADPGKGQGPKLTVMTQNLYVGFDGPTVLAALQTGDPGVIFPAVKNAFDAVRASDFPARARAIADQAARTRPEVIGVQEVSLFRSQDPADFSPIPNATHVEIDFLQILLSALAARGLRYDPVAVIQNIDTEAPALRDDFSCCREIRLTDFEVILARRGVVRVLDVQEENYSTNLTIPLPTGSFTTRAGWVAIDAAIRGRVVRIVSTHLEPLSPLVQVAQALELLSGPAQTTLPLILLGDFNSAADGSTTATYGLLTDAGLVDTWNAAHPGDPGPTCCQAADLLNPTSTLTHRIDIVFTRGEFEVLDSEIVGEELDDRTPAGLWPSDHAGVVSTLRLPRK